MGISRFMRNGKQRPTLWVENERATSGTRLRLTVNQMMPFLGCGIAIAARIHLLSNNHAGIQCNR